MLFYSVCDVFFVVMLLGLVKGFDNIFFSIVLVKVMVCLAIIGLVLDCIIWFIIVRMLVMFMLMMMMNMMSLISVRLCCCW